MNAFSKGRLAGIRHRLATVPGVLAILLAALPVAGFGQTDSKAQVEELLGPLANNLSMAISMDQSPNGSVVYSRRPAPTGAMFMTGRFALDEGRRCADFSEGRASLSLMGIADLGTSYTLATWAKFPFPGEDATIWEGIRGTPLFVHEGQFKCSAGKEKFSFGAYDKQLSGWHHLAVVCDANTTSLFIDGVIFGAVNMPIKATIRQIGSRMFPEDSKPTQCGLLDDMFIFDRALTNSEFATLLSVRLPIQGSLDDTNPAAKSSPLNLAPKVEVSSDATANATELVRTSGNNLVFVTGEGAGSGFIADMGGKPFLLTNAHVAAGVRGATFHTLQGAAVPMGTAAVAVGHDIFAIQAQVTGTPLSVMRDVGANASINDEVVVLGNAEGGGVINTIMGRIVGIGPELVEVNAPFQPGNSGSPIIHLKSKKVIGVATYLTYRKFDPATKMPLQDPVVRRFGYRIDSVKTWQPVDWKAFRAQAAEMESVETLTKDLVVFLKDVGEDGRVSRGMHTNPAIRSRIDAWLASKSKHMSARDAANVDQNFISFLKVTSQSDVLAAQQHITYDYFRRQLADQQTERAEIAGVFAKIIEKVRDDR